MIKWVNPPGASHLEGLSELRDFASKGGRHVIVGQHSELKPPPNEFGDTLDEAAIWWSDDGTSWTRAQLPAGNYAENAFFVLGVTVGGPGFVAVTNGGPLWSTDGTVWVEGTAPAFDNIQFHSVAQTSDGLVAVGRDFDSEAVVVIQSADGKSWTKSDALSALLTNADVRFFEGDQVLAFARKSTDKTVVYNVSAMGDWQKIATISDWIDQAAQGPSGWLAIGGYAWVGGSGANWTRAPISPIQPRGSAEVVIGDTSGYIVGSNVYPPGCAIDERQIKGFTWTSVDGLVWDKMKQSFDGRWLQALFVIDRTLVGVGVSYDHSTGDIPFGFVRTADLPPGPFAAAPLPSPPAPTPTPAEGCGL